MDRIRLGRLRGCGLVCSLQGHDYRESRAFSQRAGYVDSTLVVFHDTPCQPETQTGAVAFGGEERTEDVRQVIGRDASAVVSNLDHRGVASPFQRDRDASGLVDCLQSV